MKRGDVRCVTAALAALMAISTGATAQQPAALPPVSTTPDRMKASFEDRTSHCERPDLPAGAPRICEIAQAITVQGQQSDVVQIAIGWIQRLDPLRATIDLPLHATPSLSVMLATGDKVAKPLDASWRSYLPIGCLAELPLRDALLRRLRGISEPGAIAFKDASGRDIHLPPSFGGPAHVRDALGKE